MSILLCDVGGTHIRFALAEDNPLYPHKTRVDEYKDLPAAILSFLKNREESPDKVTGFYLAFSNRNEWNTDPQSLKKALPNSAIHQVNDFEANAHGVIQSVPSDFQRLNVPREKSIKDASKAIIGVGTGLGLAYICGAGRQFVQRTHGAHMLPAYSPVHHELYEFAAKNKEDVLIYEDMLTGRGLYNIYKFLSDKSHLFTEYQDITTLIRDGSGNPVFQQSLTIFSELLGLFAHHAVAFGYAYKGIYLTGGIIDRLMIANLFKIDPFLQYFKQNNVPIVVEDVSSVPIYWVKDEFVSLKGLQYLTAEDARNA